VSAGDVLDGDLEPGCLGAMACDEACQDIERHSRRKA
jgi:hypothetical protein